MDVLLMRKVCMPEQPELAVGAVMDGYIIGNEAVIPMARISVTEFEAACRREPAEIERRRRCYLGDRSAQDVSGRVAIVVDDGIATCATIRAAIHGLRYRKPRRIVPAVWMAPRGELLWLRKVADDVVCLEADYFSVIGSCYRGFRQLDDKDVLALLQQTRAGEPTGGEAQLDSFCFCQKRVCVFELLSP